MSDHATTTLLVFYPANLGPSKPAAMSTSPASLRHVHDVQALEGEVVSVGTGIHGRGIGSPVPLLPARPQDLDPVCFLVASQAQRRQDPAHGELWRALADVPHPLVCLPTCSDGRTAGKGGLEGLQPGMGPDKAFQQPLANAPSGTPLTQHKAGVTRKQVRTNEAGTDHAW